MEPIAPFIALDPINMVGLFLIGFVGGMVSGFIGSGGAFVLTPAMMSMGVPGIVAVASNMCHKFPKALVGAYKRAKYGQVDLKLGIIFGLAAEAGVLVGAHLQQAVERTFGNAGSNLYVSVVFVIVLSVVGGFVLRDGIRSWRAGDGFDDNQPGRLARRVQAINIPGTMMYFKSIGTRVSVLILFPLGFATGLLAATIAVGGFIGVPSMMYVLGVPGIMASATELVVAFVMGLGGSIKFASAGFVDIRLAMIILAGSLFGIQIGAIGTTYVRPYVIKLVMGVIMVTVLFSRLIVIPVYLADLELIGTLPTTTERLLRDGSFYTLVAALLIGAAAIFRALWIGMRESRGTVAA